MKKSHPWLLIISAGVLVPLIATIIERLTPDREVDLNNLPSLLLMPGTLVSALVLYAIFALIVKSARARIYGAITISVLANLIYVVGIVIRLTR